MTMLASRKVLLAKEEANLGVDPTPTPAANTIDARNIVVKEAGDILDRDNARATLSKVAGVLGKRSYEITFEVDLKGSGAAGTAPRIGDLLEACGFAETASAGSSVEYSPTSIPVSTKSLTLYYYQLGDASAILKKLTASRGTFRLVMGAGQIPRLEFTFRGKYNAPADVAIPTGMAFEATKPPIVESAGFTFGETALVTREVALDIGNELVDKDDINTAGGILEVAIGDRKPTGTFNPEMVLLATKNFHTLWTGATESALELTIGSVAGNIIDIIVPKTQLEGMSEDPQNNIQFLNVPFRCNGNAGDDEICLRFR